MEIRIGDTTIKENWFDRTVRYFAPVKAQRRFSARAVMALTGGYIGGSRTRRNLKTWNPRSNDPDSDLLPDFQALRERSRDLIRNSPLAGGAINTNVTSVVGSGLRLQSRIDREVLSMTEDEASDWERNTEREFRLFFESQEVDMARTLNGYGIQDLCLRSTLESGDTFLLMPMINRPGSPYRTKLQVIEGDRVSNPNDRADSLSMSGGVERDQYGAPVRYHILKTHPGNVLIAQKREWMSVPAFGAGSGRRNVIHAYTVLRPGQTRGVPYLAPVISHLKSLDRYTDAEIEAAVVSGFLTVFIKSGMGEGLSPMEPTSETGGSSTDKDYKLGPAALLDLAPGEEVQTVTPGRPNQAFEPFVQAVLRQIGVGLELPFEILVKHFTASYSASRAAMLEAWRFFMKRRSWLTWMVCQPIYENWMAEAVAIGRISAPGFFSDPIMRKAYLGSEWIGPARGQIDELKEMKAARERIDGKLSTHSEECATITGGDWETKMNQASKEKKKLEELGLGFNGPKESGKEATDTDEEEVPTNPDQLEQS